MVYNNQPLEKDEPTIKYLLIQSNGSQIFDVTDKFANLPMLKVKSMLLQNKRKLYFSLVKTPVRGRDACSCRNFTAV